jgi:hypothetical protein
MRRVGVILVLIAIPLSAPVADGGLRLSDGQIIDTPPVSGMDCPALSEKLSEIDVTGYRGSSPTPRNPADLPLLAYEEKVATAFFRGCVMRALGEKQPSVAFTEGYRGKN